MKLKNIVNRSSPVRFERGISPVFNQQLENIMLLITKPVKKITRR
jgi:hypothetical protein